MTQRTAVGYTRVSTEEQADSRLGLEAQRTAIEAAAQRHGLTVSAWFADEGVGSDESKLEHRTGLLASLEALRRDDVLIVAKRDRLARDRYLIAWIEKEAAKARASILSAAGEGNGDSPEDILMRHMVDAFGEYERRQIKARTKAALAAKRARGQRISRHAPYGYRQNGDRWVSDPGEQEAVRLMLDLRRRGASLREISARLARGGHVSRSGRPLGAETIRRAIDAHS